MTASRYLDEPGRLAMIERSRQPSGQFGSQAHTAPLTASNAGGERPLVSEQKGSFQFPEAKGFDGTVEDHLDFYMNAPVPEELLRSATSAYKEAYQQAVLDSEHRVFMEDRNDPTIVAHGSALPGREINAYYDRIQEQSYARGRQEAEEAWPAGPSLSSFSVRTVMRIGQAIRMSSTLRDEDEVERLYQTEYEWRSGSRETFVDMYDRFNVSSWIDNV